MATLVTQEYRVAFTWDEAKFIYEGKDWTDMEITSMEEIIDPKAESAADTILASVDRDARIAMALRQFQAAYRVAVRNNDELPVSFTDAYNFSISIPD